MKKILIISCIHTKTVDPTLIPIYLFTEQLNKDGYSTMLITSEHDKPDSFYCDIYDPSRFSGKSYSFKQYLSERFLNPDSMLIRKRKNMKNILEMVRTERPDVMLSAPYPYTNCIIASEIKRNFPEIHWVAELCDEWTSSPIKSYSNRILRKEIRSEHKVVSFADRLYTSTDAIRSTYLDSYPDIKNKFSVIPHPYNKECLYNAVADKSLLSDRMRITYIGKTDSVHSLNSFLTALALLFVMKKVPRDKILLTIVGQLNIKAFTNEIKSYLLEGETKIININDNGNNINTRLDIYENSDVFILSDKSLSGCSPLLSEYLYLRKPVLAIVPDDSDNAHFVAQNHCGDTTNGESIESLQNAILQLYKRWLSGKITLSPSNSSIADYDICRIYPKLKLLMDKESGVSKLSL